MQPGRIYRKDETIARGYVQTGDQVFVDKMSYNFVNPRRGDVFVFKTNGIRRIEVGLPPGIESQHYIKRLAGIPGDTLRIDSPFLFLNGRQAFERVFQRVMAAKTDIEAIRICTNFLTSRRRRKHSPFPTKAISLSVIIAIFARQPRFRPSS